MISSRKNLFLITIFGVVFLFFISSQSHAQSFEEGINYYHQKKYKQAVSVFNGLKNPQGYLFTGKSFYALGKYDLAQSNLNSITTDAPLQIYEESVYTTGLINFQRKQFGEALAKLYKVSHANVGGGLRERASTLYNQILAYLSADQRMQALKIVDEDETRFDILKTGMGKMTLAEAQKSYKIFRENTDSDTWRSRGREVQDPLGSVSAYRKEYGSGDKKLSPPAGTVYTIGIALPEYQPDAREFGIVKALYFGAMLAADEYNKNNGHTRAYIRFVDTGTSADNLENKVKQFKNKHNGDALIGPLYSDQAEPMVSIASGLKMPTIAPLANSDIDADNSFLYQANPTFRLHGKELANYAVNVLNYNNLAIIANTNSKGAISAEAFKEEAQKDGANVAHYFIKNLQANKYAISEYTQYFGSTVPIDAVYAPFTGPRAPALIDLLIANLKSMDQSLTILGSQEYRNLNYQSTKYQNLNLYFSESTVDNNGSGKLSRFKNAYQHKFGGSGNKYSMIGYDIARFILEALNKVGNPDLLKQAITQQPLYHGLVQDFNFSGGNVNQALKIMKVSQSGNPYAVN